MSDHNDWFTLGAEPRLLIGRVVVAEKLRKLVAMPAPVQPAVAADIEGQNVEVLGAQLAGHLGIAPGMLSIAMNNERNAPALARLVPVTDQAHAILGGKREGARNRHA